MKVIECKGFDKKELVNVSQAGNLKDLANLDSFVINGAAIYETTHPVTGELTGGVALKTDAGTFAGISTAVYNAAECMLEMYVMKELKNGIPAKIRAIETDGDRERLVLELL